MPARGRLVQCAVPAHAERLARAGRDRRHGRRPVQRHQTWALHRRPRRVVHRSTALQLPVRRRRDPRDHERQTRRDGEGCGLPVADPGLLGVVRRHRRPVDLSALGHIGGRQRRARPDQCGQPRLPAGAFPPGHGSEHGGPVMLTRDEALKICDTLLAHAKAAGAEDASIAVNGSIESHARLAENRVTTSGHAENLGISVTVWVGQRRGSASGNDDSPEALKRMADEAVQIARLSPVHREYVPTLGPVDYGETRGFADSTANIDLDARASALDAVLQACRQADVTGAGFHRTSASAQAAATANGNRRYFRMSEGAFSLTARSADGTGSGYYAGDHFDLSRLDVPKIAEQAVNKAVRSQNPKAIEPGTYPVILEPEAVANLL